MIEKRKLKNQAKVLQTNRKQIKYHKQVKTITETGEQEETEVLNTAKREPLLQQHGLHQEVL